MDQNLEIRQKLVDYLLDICDVKEQHLIKDSSLLKEDLMLDSMQAVNMITDIEEEYGFQIDDSEIMSLKTVGDILGLIQQKNLNN